MVFFLYMSVIVSILLCTFLLGLQFKILTKKNYSDGVIWNYMTKYLIKDTIIACLLIIIMAFMLPFSIWSYGTKKMGVEDIVLNITNISPISTINKIIYVKESYKKDMVEYSLKDNYNNSVIFDSNSAELVNLDSIDQPPEYKLVAQYKIKELQGDNIITRSVNDMYANIYLDQDKHTFIGNKVKIYVSKDSVEK